jgi:hypothetical protein
MGGQKVVNNLELRPDEGCVVVSVNPRIYSLAVVYSAARLFLDQAFVTIDGNPSEEIIVELRSKSSKGLEDIGRDFDNELITQLVGGICASNDTADTKEAPVTSSMEDCFDGKEGNCRIDGLAGVARPWEDVYGKGRN